MNEIKRKLINQAVERYTSIFPCTRANDLNECFTIEDNVVMFWFNTEDKTTHILTATVPQI
ncbi:hypothetical protein CHISP_0755 [Chitinispirillum alkaliphilum]|nr:hypothetical protein CHISP_0755 [Chitinispirillum alkaliphilum]